MVHYLNLLVVFPRHVWVHMPMFMIIIWHQELEDVKRVKEINEHQGEQKKEQKKDDWRS